MFCSGFTPSKLHIVVLHPYQKARQLSLILISYTQETDWLYIWIYSVDSDLYLWDAH